MDTIEMLSDYAKMNNNLSFYNDLQFNMFQMEA